MLRNRDLGRTKRSSEVLRTRVLHSHLRGLKGTLDGPAKDIQLCYKEEKHTLRSERERKGPQASQTYRTNSIFETILLRKEHAASIKPFKCIPTINAERDYQLSEDKITCVSGSIRVMQEEALRSAYAHEATISCSMPPRFHCDTHASQLATCFSKAVKRDRVCVSRQHHARRHMCLRRLCFTIPCSSSKEGTPQSPGPDEATKLLDALQRQQTIGSEYGEVKFYSDSHTFTGCSQGCT